MDLIRPFLRVGLKLEEESIIDLVEYLQALKEDTSVAIPEGSSIHKWDAMTQDKFRDIKNSYDVDTILNVISDVMKYDMHKRDLEFVSNSLTKLAVKILDIKEGEKVINPLCGGGNILKYCNEAEEKAEYYGVEKNKLYIRYARAVLKEKINIIEGESLEFMTSPKNKEQYDKAMIVLPFGPKKYKYDHEDVKSLVPEELKKFLAGSELAYLIASLNMIKDGGKIVALMTGSGLFNTRDKRMREYLYKQGYIESVTALGERLFLGSHAPAYMMVLSKKNNENIMMVDAQEIYHKDKEHRMSNALEDKDIEEILSLLKSEDEKSRLVGENELEDKLYELIPDKYFFQEVKLNNAAPLKKAVKKIRRGAQLVAKSMDEMISSKDTGCYSLKLADIANGVIPQDLTCIKELTREQEKFCLRENDLIMTKTANPNYRLAVADNLEKKKILVTGNMFILELNLNVVDPYYLKAFLESETGAYLLANVSNGAVVQNLNTKKMMEMLIELPPLEEQKKIAEKYRAIQQQILDLQKELENNKKALKEILQENK